MRKTLHIFNPEHDLALAADIDNFTAPHAARQLRSGLGFLPALWASDGDLVLVDDPDYAKEAYRRLCLRISRYMPWRSHDVRFVGGGELCDCFSGSPDIGLCPWGWDRSLVYRLSHYGVPDSFLPSYGELRQLRLLSHRRTGLCLLRSFSSSPISDMIIGESFECLNVNEVLDLIYKYNKVVVKAPWSCSGRGVRFLGGVLDEHTLGWLRNTLRLQGSVMVEPQYDKVMDFGMEFEKCSDGVTRFLGLSLFHTVKGSYSGNLLATGKAKRDILSRYISLDLLDNVCSHICSQSIRHLTIPNGYIGPFGVDMMIVSREDGEGFLLHPCVEVNIRRTMGHVALCIEPDDDERQAVMSIDTGSLCKLRIGRTMP